MKKFWSFIIKETKHITRDSRTMLIFLGIPVTLMLLFGFAISVDIRDVKVAIVTASMDNHTQRIVQRLNQSEYFTITHTVGTTAEAQQLLSDNRANLAIVFSDNFANHRYDGEAAVQFIADFTDPNTAEQQVMYAQQIIADEMMAGQAESRTPTSNTKLLFNPQMKSTYNFVPGIMGMLLLLLCTMMTSLSIVREKERGTMELMLASPIPPIYMIIAKAVPYLVMSFVIQISILLISKFVLNVPVVGSVLLIMGVSFIYVILALSLGLLISIISKTQVESLIISGMMLILPSVLLSGLFYPVESMPKILQAISAVIPVTWYISAIRKIMIMGSGAAMVGKEVIILTVMAALLLFVSLKKFKIRLS